jgi:hypothetical protein
VKPADFFPDPDKHEPEQTMEQQIELLKGIAEAHKNRKRRYGPRQSELGPSLDGTSHGSSTQSTSHICPASILDLAC